VLLFADQPPNLCQLAEHMRHCSAASALKFAMHARVNVKCMTWNIARNVLRNVLPALKSAEEWKKNMSNS
jgi:hypothetical protein